MGFTKVKSKVIIRGKYLEGSEIQGQVMGKDIHGVFLGRSHLCLIFDEFAVSIHMSTQISALVSVMTSRVDHNIVGTIST